MALQPTASSVNTMVSQAESTSPPTTSFSERFDIVRRLYAPGLNNLGMCLVNDKLTGKQAVFKALEPDRMNVREAEKLERLKGHPNVVGMLGFVPAPPVSDKKMSDKIYMEFCSTKVGTQQISTLRDLIAIYERSPLPECFIWEVLESVLRALCYLQFGVKDVMVDSPASDWEPIIHRDIKADNILLTDSETGDYPRILLCDFGIAQNRQEMWEELEPGENSSRVWGTRSLPEANDMYTSDAEDFGGLIFLLCHHDEYGCGLKLWKDGRKLGDESWRSHWSNDLRRVVQPLNTFTRDLDLGLLEYTRDVISTKGSLLVSGKLRFQPLEDSPSNTGASTDIADAIRSKYSDWLC